MCIVGQLGKRAIYTLDVTKCTIILGDVIQVRLSRNSSADWAAAVPVIRQGRSAIGTFGRLGPPQRASVYWIFGSEYMVFFKTAPLGEISTGKGS